MDSFADVVIVGAGAAGLAAGIFLGRQGGGARVAALDGAPRIGAKILVSGGGRCNVTNVRVTPADFYGGNPHVLRRILAAFPETATRAFFDEIGVPLHEEEYGKLFPDTNSARTVVDGLLGEAARCGVQIKTRHRVVGISSEGDGFVIAVETPDGLRTWRARLVVLATGGLSLPKTGSDGTGYGLARRLGHSVSTTTPALDPLLLDGDFHAALSGVSHDVELSAHVDGRKPVRIAGPVLWTHFGMSGPAALNISRFWNRARCEERHVGITANFAVGADYAAVEHVLLDAARTAPNLRVSNALRRWLPARVADALCERVGVPLGRTIAQLRREARRALVRAIVEWPVPVCGTRGYRYAEVTAGGVPLAEVDPSTMASRVCPGLYLVGEMLDVDGRIGGFNFQWAWSSGYVAGLAMARCLATVRSAKNEGTERH